MNTRIRILSNLIWRFSERAGAQSIKFLVEIILARLLLPNDYGVIALITVIITLLNVFVDSGLATALIQKKEADDLDFSSVFWFNLVWGGILYLLLFIFSPGIAEIFKVDEMTTILRVLGIEIIIAGIKNVQQAYVSRTLQFKRFFFSTLGGTIGAALIGIVLAYKGFGVWALVYQHLFNTFVDTVILWITVNWHPKLIFSFFRLRKLLSYGWNIFVSILLDAGYNEAQSLIIGKLYMAPDLAYYNRGRQFPAVIVSNINASIDSVLFPTLSLEQEDKMRVYGLTRKAIRVSVYIMMPLMVMVVACAEPIVRLVLTEKWIPCVFYLRIFCIMYIFYPVHSANLNAIKAMGRSDLFLRLEIIKIIVGITVLFVTMWFGVQAIAYGLLFVNFIGLVINSWPNKKLINYSYIDQMKDILPSIILGSSMGICVYSLSFLGFSDLNTLICQLLAGGAIFILGSILLHFEPFEYLILSLKDFIKGRK